VKSGSTSNYGRATTLRVDGDPVTTAYLKFSVPDPGGTILRARLRVWVSAGSSSGFEVHKVSDTTWSETAMTWSNAPSIDPSVVASTGRTTTGTWVTIEVTQVVTGSGTYCLALVSNGTSSSTYGSRESGSTAPQLLLDVAS
jgi:hypothetical protein